MSPKLKKSKQYTLGSGGLPESLVDRLHLIPQYFDKEKHPLSTYLDEEIIPPPGLDILLLDDFAQCCLEVGLSPDTCAFYLAVPNYYADDAALRHDIDTLRKSYGITTSRAVVFPDGNIDYPTLIHELLHDTFNNLKDAFKNKLLASLKEDAPYLFATNQIPDLNHLQLRFVDEFIAYLFSRTVFIRGYLFGSGEGLLNKFGKTLCSIGYKI